MFFMWNTCSYIFFAYYLLQSQVGVQRSMLQTCSSAIWHRDWASLQEVRRPLSRSPWPGPRSRSHSSGSLTANRRHIYIYICSRPYACTETTLSRKQGRIYLICNMQHFQTHLAFRWLLDKFRKAWGKLLRWKYPFHLAQMYHLIGSPCEAQWTYRGHWGKWSTRSGGDLG